MNLQEIKELSKREPKSLLERLAKLQEESGELAQEVLIANNASGFKHKEQGKDGILGECVDVLLVCLSIYFKNGGSEEGLEKSIANKCSKWRANQDVKKEL